MFSAVSSYPILNQRVVGSHSNAKVVFVGGGPVGLFTAIQVRILTGKPVTVIEKYQTYRRTQNLRIDKHSFNGICQHAELQALIEPWKNRTVSIQAMENGLTSLANQLGVNIIRGYQARPEELPDLFPEAKVFVGSDGARSSVRETIFQDNFRFNTHLQYLVQAQYRVKNSQEPDIIGKKIKLQRAAETYSMEKFAEHIVVQNTRPLPNGDSQVTLQIFVDKKVYDQMSDASFKNPYFFEIDHKKIPHELQQVLKKWWGARSVLHKENIQKDSNNKLTVIALNSYAAKEMVSQDEHGRIWTLVGDASAAFPFFRAINTGFLMGTKLASTIAQTIEKKILLFLIFKHIQTTLTFD